MVAVQIRDVSPAVRDDLAAEAHSRGLSLQAYLREVLEEHARMHRRRQWLARQRVGTEGAAAWQGPTVVDLIRADRDRDESAFRNASDPTATPGT